MPYAVFSIVAMVAFAAWASSALHAVWLLRYVAPPREPYSLLFRGYLFFRDDTFVADGAPFVRRMRLSFAVFVAAACGLVALSPWVTSG